MMEEGLILLVTEWGWGPISEDQRREWSDEKKAIFSCGRCSTEKARVFHNVWGQHNHRSADVLVPLMPAEE